MGPEAPLQDLSECCVGGKEHKSPLSTVANSQLTASNEDRNYVILAVFQPVFSSPSYAADSFFACLKLETSRGVSLIRG